MPSYPLDVDPEQVVRWVMDEQKVAPSGFRIQVRRSAELRDIPVRQEFHLGDEEREDLTEIVTIATLEIAPAHAGEGWLLTVVVEDEAGPRLPDKGSATGTEEQIDLRAFYNEFIRTKRGVANVFAEATNEAAETHIEQLLDSIETNRHSPGQRPPTGSASLRSAKASGEPNKFR